MAAGRSGRAESRWRPLGRRRGRPFGRPRQIPGEL